MYILACSHLKKKKKDFVSRDFLVKWWLKNSSIFLSTLSSFFVLSKEKHFVSMMLPLQVSPCKLCSEYYSFQIWNSKQSYCCVLMSVPVSHIKYGKLQTKLLPVTTVAFFMPLLRENYICGLHRFFLCPVNIFSHICWGSLQPSNRWQALKGCCWTCQFRCMSMSW